MRRTAWLRLGSFTPCCEELRATGSMGARAWFAWPEGAGLGHRAGGSGRGAAGAPDCVFNRQAASGAVFGAEGAGRKARDANRRYGIHRQGVAGEYVDGYSRHRKTVSADQAAKVEPSAT